MTEFYRAVLKIFVFVLLPVQQPRSNVQPVEPSRETDVVDAITLTHPPLESSVHSSQPAVIVVYHLILLSFGVHVVRGVWCKLS